VSVGGTINACSQKQMCYLVVMFVKGLLLHTKLLLFLESISDSEVTCLVVTVKIFKTLAELLGMGQD